MEQEPFRSSAFANLIYDPDATRLCLSRTRAAVHHVVDEIHGHILDQKDLVHSDQVNLANLHSSNTLSSRYLEGMPTRLKVALGRPDGIDFDELVTLSHDKDCATNSKSIGAYLIFGWGLQRKAASESWESFSAMNPPSPVYGGESYLGHRGMKGRTKDHTRRSSRDNYRRRMRIDKLLYEKLDDPNAPQEAYALSMFKDKVIDKIFGKFAEMVTRTLLGTSADVPRCRICSRFKTHGILSFKTPIVPTNCTDVLREGTIDLATADAKYTASHAFGLRCNRCDTLDANHWRLDPETEDRLVCERCFHCCTKHGVWPDRDRIERREVEKAQRADRKQREAPGHCENTHCGIKKNQKPSWYWISELKIWTCSNCARRYRECGGELRVPHSGPGYCENERCRATTITGNWNWNDNLGLWLCPRCRDYARHHHDDLWEPYPEHCENQHCDNPISSSNRHRHKVSGIWICGACDCWARRHNDELRKPAPTNVMGVHVGLCQNPQCAATESSRWLWCNTLELTVCWACYQWAQTHHGELRTPKATFVGPCQNPHCGHRGPTKWCWSEALQIHVCSACHVWAKRHDGNLRKPKDKFLGPCQNPQCATVQSKTWHYLEPLRLRVCGACYRFARNHDGDLRKPRVTKRKRDEWLH